MDHYIEVTFYILVFILASILTDPAVMYAGEVEVSQSDIVVATLILEAGGEYVEGAMEAVHEVILNRSAIRQMTPAEVCLQPHQFASWSVEDQLAQLNKAKSHPRWGEAFIITLYPQTNYTSGADHFHADYIDPSWNKHMKVTAKIGRHIFYK